MNGFVEFGRTKRLAKVGVVTMKFALSLQPVCVSVKCTISAQLITSFVSRIKHFLSSLLLNSCLQVVCLHLMFFGHMLKQ